MELFCEGGCSPRTATRARAQLQGLGMLEVIPLSRLVTAGGVTTALRAGTQYWLTLPAAAPSVQTRPRRRPPFRPWPTLRAAHPPSHAGHGEEDLIKSRYSSVGVSQPRLADPPPARELNPAWLPLRADGEIDLLRLRRARFGQV